MHSSRACNQVLKVISLLICITWDYFLRLHLAALSTNIFYSFCFRAASRTSYASVAANTSGIKYACFWICVIKQLKQVSSKICSPFEFEDLCKEQRELLPVHSDKTCLLHAFIKNALFIYFVLLEPVSKDTGIPFLKSWLSCFRSIQVHGNSITTRNIF